MAKAKSNLIKREKTLTVYVKEGATPEELKEVKMLVAIGWTSKPCKPKKTTNEEEHEVTKDFNISYDEVRKEDMVKYIKEFVKDDENALKKFSIASHKDKNGEVKRNAEGKQKYNQLSAKKYFFKTYFPDRWEEIEKMLEKRQFNSNKKKKANTLEDELLALLND